MGGRIRMSGQLQKTRRKDRLWIIQNGQCHYCKRKMIHHSNKYNERQRPPLLSTLEHLDNKLTGKRTVNKMARTVLACYECNHRKGIEDEKAHKQDWGFGKVREQIIRELWKC